MFFDKEYYKFARFIVLSKWGELIMVGNLPLIICYKSGLLVEFDEYFDRDRYFCKMKRKGIENPIASTYSIADAIVDGVVGTGGWTVYPKSVLMYRNRSMVIEKLFPDIMQGLRPGDESEANKAENRPVKERAKEQDDGSDMKKDLEEVLEKRKVLKKGELSNKAELFAQMVSREQVCKD